MSEESGHFILGWDETYGWCDSDDFDEWGNPVGFLTPLGELDITDE